MNMHQIASQMWYGVMGTASQANQDGSYLKSCMSVKYISRNSVDFYVLSVETNLCKWFQ